MRALLLAALLAGAPASAQGAVLLLPAVGSTRQVTVAGRALKHGAGGSRHALKKNLGALLTANDAGAEVEVRFLGRSAQVKAGHDGNFEVTFDAGAQPFAVGPQAVEARTRAGAAGATTVDVVADQAPFVVVSDFDDTLAVTNVVDKKGLVKAALLEDEATQPAVPGMSAFYGCLRAASSAKPGFALVSGSPVQYAPRLGAFLGKHGFPLFGLYLRDLGPNTLADYKQPVIRALLEALPHKVVLVGDSGERDPEVYAQIRSEFPERVLAVYIRDAGRVAEAARFRDVVLFKDPAAAARDAVQRKLASPQCVEAAFAGAESR